MAAERIATWIPATDEMLADAHELSRIIVANFEYADSPARLAPLSVVEALTGWRYFTASNGITLTLRVGWRVALHDAIREFAREAWPEDYAEDEDD